MDVLAALGRLPERQRVAVTLRYLQDLPYAEISGATGWPEGTAKTLVRRGLARLRKMIIVDDSKDGGAHRAAARPVQTDKRCAGWLDRFLLWRGLTTRDGLRRGGT